MDMMDEGMIDARVVADMALMWLSEHSVAEMMRARQESERLKFPAMLEEAKEKICQELFHMSFEVYTHKRNNA
jgi:hypothetical protein